MKRILFILFFLFTLQVYSGFANAEQTVSGVVFNDSNNNGLLDSKERGIKGVAVSNGILVVLTNRNGRYEIPLEEGSTLFISKPRGYSLPLSKDNIPQFFYTSFPETDHNDNSLRYPGSKPFVPVKGDINFPLHRKKEPENYRMIWISDPQTRTNEELDFFRDRFIHELAGSKAAFGITTGDIMFDDLSLFPRYSALISEIGIPWFNLPGNHDLNLKSPDDKHSLDTYSRYFGPSYYSFNFGRTHYILLDNFIYKGTDPEKPNLSGGYDCSLDERQLKWIEADLAHVPKKMLIVIAMHGPLKAVGIDFPGVSMNNTKALLKLLTGFKQVFSVAGHLHGTQHVYLGTEDGYMGNAPLHQHIIATAAGNFWSGAKDNYGIPYTTQADGTPNGYYIMDVKGNNVTMRYRAAGRPADCQMRIMLETQPDGKMAAGISKSHAGSVRILVNLFDGGERSHVSYSMDNGPLVKMEKEMRHDPFAYKSYIDVDIFNKGMKTISTHMWSADMPEEILPGAHTITVYATNEYGQEHIGRKVFEIAD